MPFPLPLDPFFRREIIQIWLWDISDRLRIGDLPGAKQSWKIANDLYLGLPPGEGDMSLENQILTSRVKLDEAQTLSYANHLQRNGETNTGNQEGS